MADDTLPPDDEDKPPSRKRRADREDEQPSGGRAKRRNRDDEEEEEEEEWEDSRPRRRRRREREEEYDPSLRMVVPLNTSALAIIAGYLGLVSVLCVPAPFALLVGILALQQLKKNPKLDGKSRAIFAIVMGMIFSCVLVGVGVLALVG